MNKKSIYSLGFIWKIGAGILLAFILVLVSFIMLQNQSAEREREDKLVINIFGKQRMYTQMMAKDSSSLYALMKDLEDSNISLSSVDVLNKYLEYKDNLREAADRFTETLEALEHGYLKVEAYDINIGSSINEVAPYLEDIKPLWEKFARAVMTMIRADEITNEFVIAATFINLNNLKLMELCEQIQQVILTDSLRTDHRTDMAFYTLIGILSILMVIAVLNLMKFIILPFNRLYRGISEIGLDSDHEPINHKTPTSKRVIPMVEDINAIFIKINNLIDLIENMNSYSSFAESLDFINRTFSQFIPYNYIGIALFDDTKINLRASYGVSDGSIAGMPDNIVGINWPIRETSLGQLIASGSVRIINDLEQYLADKPVRLYNKIILEAGIRASITLPLQVAGEPVGVIFFSSRQKNVYSEKHLNFLKTLVNGIAVSFNQNIFINDLVFSSILALAKLAEARDEETGEHLDRMKLYSRLIAELLYENHIYPGEITPEYFDKIERFSPLHDIGKVAVRDGILLKPGKLTEEEFEEMKQHALYGARVLRAAEENIVKRGRSLFGMGIEIAEGHHEKWDGSGYPYGKSGSEIPLSARIVALADVFDALTSKRPYKKAFSFELSMNIIEEGRGKHFDPKIADVFLANRNRVEQMYEEFMKTEGSALV